MLGQRGEKRCPEWRAIEVDLDARRVRTQLVRPVDVGRDAWKARHAAPRRVRRLSLDSGRLPMNSVCRREARYAGCRSGSLR